MSFLLDRPGTSAAAAGELPPSPVGAPALAALRAAVGGLVPVAVPVVLAWVLGAGGQATWTQAVRLSLGLWLLAHHAGLEVSGGHVGLVPLGMVPVPLCATWLAGRRLARTMDPRADRIAAGATRAAPRMLSWRCLATFVGVYCLLAVVAAVVAGMPGLRPVSAQAAVGSAAISLLGGGFGAVTYRCGGMRRALLQLSARLPQVVQPWLRPALAAVALHVGAGAGLVAVLIGGHFAGVTDLQRALEPGLVGGTVLTLGEVLLLPNLVLWASAATAGPGFAIGTGTSVGLGAVHLGALPAIPVLAALPAPGPMPAMAWALLAVPVLAGVAAGVVVVRARPAVPFAARVQDAAGAVALCGLTAGALAWLSGGPAGPGRLAEVGPQPLLTAVAVAVEVGAGALLALGAAALAPRLADAVTSRGASRLRDDAGAPPDDGRTPDGTAADRRA